jgi:hypothetical protein
MYPVYILLPSSSLLVYNLLLYLAPEVLYALYCAAPVRPRESLQLFNGVYPGSKSFSPFPQI